MYIKPDEFCQIVQVKVLTEAGYDEQGQWHDAQEILVATIDGADIQPKSGRERAAEVQTSYESDYKMFAFKQDITFEAGYSELKQGMVVVDEAGKRYKIVFPGNWEAHYEADLKAE